MNNKQSDFGKRLVGLSYMGDSSHVIASALRAIGLNAEVMPTRTKESIDISKKIVNTNTCMPFSFQVGDQIAWLESYKKKGIDINKKLAIFMPTAKGPCRFGQYYVVLKKFFEERGFGGVLIISPSSNEDYTNIDFSKKQILTISKLAFKGVIANELLKSCLFRTRPYEIKKGESDKIYKKSHNELIKLLEKNPNAKTIRKFLELKQEEFKKINKINKRFPLVLVNGEIFVRSHEICNNNSIRLLEENKLEVVLEPIFSWIEYVNKNVLKKSIQTKNFFKSTISLIKRIYIKNVLNTLSKPFGEYLKGRESHDSFKLIQDIEDEFIYNSAIEGESCVSIGGAYAFIKGKIPIDGIYHVGPWGCMHETIASSRVHALINKSRNYEKLKLFPYMDAVFGDTPIPNLDSQIAIFAENCWLKKEMSEKN